MSKICYIDSKPVSGIVLGSQNTNCLTHIPEDIKLDLDPLNVTVVGSPTVSGRVFSGFSASNYLTLPKVFNPSSNTWEIVINAQLGSSTSDSRGLIGASNSKDYQGIALVVKSNKLYLYMSSNGTSWDIASNVAGKTTLNSGGLYYYIKLAFTGSAYIVSYSTNTIDWNTEISVSSTAKVYASANPLALGYVKYTSSSTQYFNGKIDLLGSYIKINGSTWWEAGTGQLTLKAGSKVYFPNGFEDDGTTPKFDEVVIENDITGSHSSMVGSVLVTRNREQNVFNFTYLSSSSSGSSFTPATYSMYYDTANNIMKRYGSSTSSYTEESLPLAIVTSNKGSVTSIDQVFNGFGYIGSTLFALKGVKGLIPDGFKENGTYKNIVVITDSVLIDSGSGSLHTFFLQGANKLESTADSMITSSTLPTAGSKYERCYVTSENQWYYHTAGSSDWIKTSLVPCGSMSQSDGKITSLTINPVQPEMTIIPFDRVYQGSQLIWGYDSDSILFENSASGTYTLKIDFLGDYKLLFVGNGGGGGSCQHDSKWFQASGGSGACFEGVVRLPAGTYTLTLGTLGYGANVNGSGNMASGVDSTDSYLVDSEGNELIRVGCGARGKAKSVGGAGGVLKLGTLEILSTSIAKNGNTGNYKSNTTSANINSTSGYALSAYDNTKTGYGAGTGSWRYGGNVYGIAGIFRLETL